MPEPGGNNTLLYEIQSDDYRLYLKASRVLVVHTFPNREYDADLTKNIMDKIRQISGGKKLLILLVAGDYSSVSMDGLKTLATPEAFVYAIAKAYVVSGLAQRLTFNFYINVFKPTVPLKIFTDVRTAEAWLLKNFRSKLEDNVS